MKRVLLTGASGFIGAHVLRRLLAGPDVQVAALLRRTSRTWRIQGLAGRFVRLDADLSEPTRLRDVLTSFRPDTVIHLAWSDVGRAGRDDPGQLENIAVTGRFVELCRAAGVRHWIGIGSQAEYGPQPGPIDEAREPHPRSLYGIAKLAAATVSRCLCERASIRWSWIRIFSCYGPMDSPDLLIPSVIKALLEGRRPALTAGEQQWDYLFVEDAADAICRVARLPEAQGFFNLGSGQVHSIRSVVELIRELANPAGELGFGDLPYPPGAPMHLQADIGRLRTVTGWEPRTSLREGLLAMVDWLRHHPQARAPEPMESVG